MPGDMRASDDMAWLGHGDAETCALARGSVHDVRDT